MPADVFLTAEWRHLVMLNYLVDPAILRGRAPAGTEIDSFEGRTYISVVGFWFSRTRVLGWPIPFHRDFEEINLRFYVRREAAEGRRRGVVFIREIVPRRAIAWAARRFYNENYAAMPMRHRIEIPPGDGETEATVEYGFKSRSGWNLLRVTTCGAPRTLEPGSQAEFITEHFWGYARQRDGGTVEYQVEHPSWRVREVSEARLECRVAESYGGEFVETLAAKPASAFLAEGSPVIVRKGRRL
jgi:uncharacterized protein YqjF (DUF2071 family)